MKFQKIIATLMVALFTWSVQAIDLAPLKQLEKYTYSNDEKIPNEVFKLLVDAEPANYAEIESALISMLSISGTSQEAKALICRLLQRIGSDACVPALTPFLKDEPMSSYARFVLERLASRPAVEALHQGLGVASDAAKVGIIGSLENLNDASSVALLGKLTSDKNPMIASQSMISIGKIGGIPAATLLLSLNPDPKLTAAYIQALLEAARTLKGKEAVALVDKALGYNDARSYGFVIERLIETDPSRAEALIIKTLQQENTSKTQAALRLIASGKLSDNLIRAVGKFAKESPSTNTEELLRALGASKNPLVAESIVGYIQSDKPELKTAAIDAIAGIGDFEVMKKLLKTQDPAVVKALARRDRPNTDKELIDLLKDTEYMIPVMDVLAKRGTRSATLQVLEVASKAEASVQAKAWKTLALMGDDRLMTQIAKAAFEVSDPKVKNNALSCIKRLCETSVRKVKTFEMLAPFYAAGGDDIKLLLIELASLGGSESGLQLVKSALASGKEELYSKAVRSLAVWPNVSAASELLEIAKNGTREKEKLIALRGYIQLASNKMIQLSPEQRGQILKEAISLVTRTEEKMLVASALAFPSGPEHVAYAAEYLKVEETRPAALAAIKEYMKSAGNNIDPNMQGLIDDYGQPEFAPLPPGAIAAIEHAVPASALAKPLKPRKLLVFYRTEGFVHDAIPYGNEMLKVMGDKTGAFKADFSRDMESFSPEKLQEYDAVLFNNTTLLKFRNPEHRKSLMDFMKQGKGLVGLHAATDNFPNWPEAQALIGGIFHGHPWNAGDECAVKNDDPENILNRAFDKKGFWIREEIYQIVGSYSRDKQRVLLSLDMSKPKNKRNNLARPDDFPISWIKADGGGRVYYTSLGHRKDIYVVPQLVTHILDGIQYALGDLKVEDAPSAKISPAVDPVLAPEEIKIINSTPVP